MASGNCGIAAACTMTTPFQPSRSHFFPSTSGRGACVSAALVLPRNRSVCCFRLPAGELGICSRRRRRRGRGKFSVVVYPSCFTENGSAIPENRCSMQPMRDGDEAAQCIGTGSDVECAIPNSADISPVTEATEPVSELACIGTGSNVECVVPNSHDDIAAGASGGDGVPAKAVFPTTNDTLSAISTSTIIDGSINKQNSFEEELPNLECIGTGTDVECVISNTKGSLNSSKKIAVRATSIVKSKENFLDSFSDSSSGSTLLVNDAEWQQQSPLLLYLKATWDYLILISPFFFWGTAMVAMKGVLPKAGPLFVAAIRLIPSGFLLIAFAQFQNRKQPSGLSAWLAIALFALVDASCFQGFLAEGLKRTSAGLGSVIIDSQPLTVAVLASILFGETIGALGVLGLATGPNSSG